MLNDIIQTEHTGGKKRRRAVVLKVLKTVRRLYFQSRNNNGCAGVSVSETRNVCVVSVSLSASGCVGVCACVIQSLTTQT